MIKELMDFN